MRAMQQAINEAINLLAKPGIQRLPFRLTVKLNRKIIEVTSVDWLGKSGEQQRELK
jgi:hypothetical protein